MTALDELRQALATVEAQNEAATPGPWRQPHGFINTLSGAKPDRRPRVMVDGWPDAELILAAVNLYRDVVPAILRDAIERLPAAEWADVDSFIRFTGRDPSDLAPALRIARAINEGASR